MHFLQAGESCGCFGTTKKEIIKSRYSIVCYLCGLLIDSTPVDTDMDVKGQCGEVVGGSR